MDSNTEELENSLTFMRGKLIETRRALEGQDVWVDVVKQDGNTVRRKNAAFDGYHDLMRTYLRALSEYREAAKGDASRSASVVKFERFAKTMKRAADA